MIRKATAEDIAAITELHDIFSAFGFKEELASLAETEGVKMGSLSDRHHLT